MSPLSERSQGKSVSEPQQRLKDIAYAASKRGLCVNLWSVSTLDTDQTNVSYLEPLSVGTGGSITKIAMSSDAPQIRALFSEKLKRALGYPHASRCTFKLRASPIVSVDAITGHVTPDDQLMGVNYMGGCSSSQAIVALLSYDSDMASSSFRYTSHGEDGERRFIALQAAFSYDTLVETGTDISHNPSPKDDFKREASGLDKPYVEHVRDCVKQFGIPTSSSKLQELYADRNRMLVSVRRLRIITRIIECIQDAPEILDGMNARLVATLMVRRALSMSRGRQLPRATRPNAVLKKSCCRRGLEAANLLEKWTIELVASLLRYSTGIVSVGRRARISKLADKTEYVKILDAVARRPVLHQLLKYLFGSMVLLTHGSTLMNRVNNVQYTAFSNDEFEDLASSVLVADHTSLSAVMYPRLLPVDSNFLVKSTLLCLRRQAMVSASDSVLFIMDAGTEVVIYKSTPAAPLNDEIGSTASEAVKRNDRFVTDVLDRIIMQSALVPLIILSSAGTESSGSLNMRLLEDASEYNDFINLIKVRALDLSD